MDFSVITESDIDPGYMSLNNKRVRHFVQWYPSEGIKSSLLKNYPAIENSLDTRLWCIHYEGHKHQM